MDDKELLILGSESGRNPYASTTFRIIPEVSSSETNGNILLPIHKTLVLYRERLRRFYRLHGLTLFSAFLTMLSSAGILLFFPLHLKEVTRSDSDGYCAALVITSLSTVLFIIIAVLIRGYSWISGRLRLAVTLSTPSVSWSNIVKIGVSSGLSILTVCYAWEEHKVICNLQIPLLGFVFVFAAITHAISRWRDFGMRRSFALLSVISGIFLSVNYAILDHERCRGVHPPPRDIWTWKVHLVWTLAFLVALWLWTVAIFSIESAIPLPHVILLVNHVYFSVGNKGVLHEKVSEKKGYLTNKIFSKFQNFKNYITIPVPTKIDGPVLYKPYLNVNAQRPDTGAIAPNPLWAGYSYGAPTTTRRTKTKLDDLHEWKTKKVHKIREIKKIIKEEPTDDEAAAASLAQRKEIAMLKKFHMHGIVDMYRPKQNSGSLAHGIGWGWSESAYAPVRKKKPKQKKKKLIKKKKKKKQAPSAGGWGEKGALAPAPKPHLPKRKKVKQKKMKNKGIGWGNDGGWSPSSVGATGGKISNHEPGSFPNFPIVNSIPPAASGRTTSNGLYGYIPKETSGYKVTNKKKKSKKRQKQKKTKKKFSNKDLLKRVLQDSASYEADSHRSKNSIEIANEHNLRQHHQRLPNKSHLNGIQEGEEHTVDEIMEPGSELYFRRMPLVFEEHYDYGDDRSIYSKFKK